nr:RAMP superfamily CRISPR-associated protein [uncultured Schaedlerella sp.]
MSGRQTFLRDKPYEFVPLLRECRKEKYYGHHVMEEDTYAGKLKLKLTTLSPLHIGGNNRDYDTNGNVIIKQMCRNGKAVIPGSSVKGAVRSIAEAVSYSCAVKLPTPKLARALPEENAASCSGIDGKLCITCTMFGMVNGSRAYKGKVSFNEFELKSGNLIHESLPKLESPFKDYPDRHDIFGESKGKLTYGNERLYYCRACENGNCQDCNKEDFFKHIEMAGAERAMEFRGRKFYSTGRESTVETNQNTCYEMLEVGSVLEGEIIFQNLKETEGRLLAYALDIGNFFTMKLGYGKPLGYGKVKIELEGVEDLESRYPVGKKISREIVESWGEKYRTDSPDEIQKVIKEFERIMGGRR